MRRIYHHTEQTDAMIRRAYASENYAGKSRRHPEIKALSQTLGWPKHIVYRLALAIGCIQATKKEPPWSEAETELLERNAHKCAHVIAKIMRKAGYRRTPTAISIRLKRSGFSRRDELIAAGIYTARALGQCLGIDSHTITRWIDKGWLAAKRAGTSRTDAQGGDHWHIKEADVRDFIIDYTAHVDIRKVDKFWLVDLLSGQPRVKAACLEAA
jgi:hypothetical protein